MNILDLPEEILSAILLNCPLKTLPNIARSCKYFSGIINDNRLWFEICARAEGPLFEIYNCEKNYKRRYRQATGSVIFVTDQGDQYRYLYPMRDVEALPSIGWIPVFGSAGVRNGAAYIVVQGGDLLSRYDLNSQQVDMIKLPFSCTNITMMDDTMYAIRKESCLSLVRFDPQHPSDFTTLVPLIAKKDSLLFCIAQGGKLFVLGHSNHCYDIATGVWTSIQPCPEPVDRSGYVTDGRYLYVLGGWRGKQATDALQRYDPHSDTWEMLSPLPWLCILPGVVYRMRTILVVGGGNGSRNLRGTAVYDIASNTWTRGKPVKLPSSDAMIRLAYSPLTDW